MSQVLLLFALIIIVKTLAIRTLKVSFKKEINEHFRKYPDLVRHLHFLDSNNLLRIDYILEYKSRKPNYEKFLEYDRPKELGNILFEYMSGTSFIVMFFLIVLILTKKASVCEIQNAMLAYINDNDGWLLSFLEKNSGFKV